MIRAISFVLGFLILTAIVPDNAQAQLYKGKTITMIVNYPAGGPTDRRQVPGSQRAARLAPIRPRYPSRIGDPAVPPK